MNMINSKMKALEWSRHFSHYKSAGFLRRSRAAYSEVSDEILPKFNSIQAFIIDIVTCKNEEDPMENEGSRVVTTFLPL